MLIANLLTALVALCSDSLRWIFSGSPVGRTIFQMTPEVSASSAVLSMNRGCTRFSGRRSDLG